MTFTFFSAKILLELPSEAYILKEAYLGTSHDKLDRVDMSLPLCDCVIVFGHYVKYVLSPITENDMM